MRETRSGNEDNPHADQRGELARLILAYQRDHRAQKYAVSRHERERLREQVSSHLKAICLILYEPFCREAHNWKKSLSFRELTEHNVENEGLDWAINRFAEQLCGHILDKLLTIRIDPNRDVIGLCVIIARRGMAKEEREIYGGKKRVGKNTIVSLPFTRLSTYTDSSSEREFDIADATSSAAFARMIDELSRESQHQMLLRVLETITHPVDRQIMIDRLLRAKPLSYKQIAIRIGDGWTADAVRKRCERLRRQLQSILGNDEGMLFIL